MKTLPSEAIDLFYKTSLEDPMDLLRNARDRTEKIENGDAASRIRGYTDPGTISGDNFNQLRIIAIHIMVRDAKNGGWLNEMQNNHAQDKVSKLFAILDLPGEPGSSPDYGRLCSEYDQIRFNVQDVGWRFQDALKRCYFAAYLQLRSGWDAVMKDPEASLNEILDYLRSGQFIEHVRCPPPPFKQLLTIVWKVLPTLIDTPENTFAFPLKTRLNALGDKLTFLMRARHDTQYKEIDDMVRTLAERALQTGLMREALAVDFSSQTAGAQGNLQHYLEGDRANVPGNSC